MSTNTRNNGPFAKFFVGVIFCIVGFMFFHFVAADGMKNGKASLNWPYTQGQIVKSKVHSYIKSDSDGSRRMYEPIIQTKYIINNEIKYTSKINVAGRVSSSSSTGARNTVNKYTVGKIVNVYYNPEDITYAILETGVPTLTYATYYGSIVFMAIGALLALSSLLKLVVVIGAVVFGVSFAFGKKKDENKNFTPAKPISSKDLLNQKPEAKVKSSPKSSQDDEDDAFDI